MGFFKTLKKDWATADRISNWEKYDGYGRIRKKGLNPHRPYRSRIRKRKKK